MAAGSDATVWLSLAGGLRLVGQDGALELCGRGLQLALPAVPSGVAQALACLDGGRVTEADLGEMAFAADSAAGVLPLHGALHALGRAGALSYTVARGDQPLATLVPVSGRLPYPPGTPPDPDRRYALSRFAAIRVGEEGVVVESPVGFGRVVIHESELLVTLARLARPTRWGDLVARPAWLDEPLAAELVALWAAASVLHPADEGAESFAAPEQPLGWWEHHDLLFHARSRFGRHTGGYGGTFHRRGVLPPPAPAPALAPARAPVPAGDPAVFTPLARPDLDGLRDHDDPFTDVLERRRSIRDYGRPLTVEQLGEFLFRAARVQHALPHSPDDLDHSLRPHPGGGAIHELVIYPVVASCEGLVPGVYRYDAFEHGLEKVRGTDGLVDGLLDLAWRTADQRSRPQVYLAITARFQRLQWKYESMVYSVVLKDVGALYQTMYLVATAMGLAPCALGGGSSDLFCDVAGLDYYAESQVGEFLLGTREVLT